jgi:Cof subfamily protein (haloacid dehalogenase superfamily)
MVSRPIRLVIADVDGTLITNAKVLTPRSRAAAEQLRAAGVLFTLTSSRPARGMRMFVDALDVSLPIGAFNGGLIVQRDGTAIAKHFLPADAVAPVLNLIASDGLDSWLFSEQDWYVRNAHGPHVEHEEMTVQFSPILVSTFDGLADNVGKLVGVSDDHDAVARCEKNLQAAFGARVSATRSQLYYVDVTHPDANKGSVVTTLSKFLNIAAENIATIGDGSNDVLMFRQSGMSIAMANAQPEVQKQAQFVTESNEHDGFAMAIERFVLPSLSA